MRKLPSRFLRLDEILGDLPVEDPLLLTELDGYLTGVVLCPEPVVQAAWMPPIWGGAYGEGAPFEDPIDVRQFAEMVAARHDEIARDLGRGKLQPIFDIDERNGDVLWESWVGGFTMAFDLCPDAWAGIADRDDAQGAALARLAVFLDIAHDESDLTSEEINALCDEAPGAIPQIMALLHSARAQPAPGPVAEGAKPGKIGRNDPCPCGSGKKHKRCCG